MQEKQQNLREKIMKKNKIKDDDLREEYDFSQMNGLVRGKYYQQYKNGTNIVHLDPDVVAAFKSEESINEALRSLINIAKEKVSVIAK